MKVASVCPACSRPASSKGRSVCLYCGAPLAPVETGKVSAAGSGRPIEVPDEHLKDRGAVSSSAPAPPSARPGWMTAAEETSPLRALLANGWVRFALVAAFILLAIYGLGHLIESHQPPGFHP